MGPHSSPSPPREEYLFSVAQIFNLPYRRFPIGRTSDSSNAFEISGSCRLEALRYSRLEICATSLPTDAKRIPGEGPGRGGYFLTHTPFLGNFQTRSEAANLESDFSDTL